MSREQEKKELGKFGAVIAIAISAVFGIILPYLWNFTLPLWPWVVSTFLIFLAGIWPIALKPLYRFWMALAKILGSINTTLILGIVYFLLILPAGGLMRLFGKDPLLRKINKSSNSYRIQRSTPFNIKQMERPF